MSRFAFVGGSYQLRNVNANCQRCENWYPEIDGSSSGASLATLEPRWGMAMFAALTGSEVRGAYFFDGRLFVVTDRFYEVFIDGTATAYSFLPDDHQPVTMAANNAGELLICAAGQLWLFPLTPPINAPIVSLQGLGSYVSPSQDTRSLQVTFGQTNITSQAPIATIQGTPGPNTLAVTCGTLTQGASAPVATVEGIQNLHGGNTLAITCGTLITQTSANVVTVQALISGPNHYLWVTFDSEPFTNNQTIWFSGLTNATWLNGQSAVVASIVGGVQYQFQSGSYTAVMPPSYGPTADTGTGAVQVGSGPMPFLVGQTVSFSGLSHNTWLNGYDAIISKISGNTFYSQGGGWLNSPAPAFPWGPNLDTGTAALPSVINGQMPFSVGQTITFSGLTNSAWWNGLNAVISSIVGNVFYSTAGSWTTQMAGSGGSLTFPYGPAADTGTAKTATITTTMPFSVGQTVYFQGLTNATYGTWLNGYAGVISSISGGTITMQSGSWLNSPNIPVFPFASVAETGTAGTALTTQVTNGIIGPIASIDFIDGYFMALLANSQQAQWSAWEEGLTWDSSNTFKVSYYPDNVVAMKVNQRNIWFLGPKQTVVYWDSGDPYNPFAPISGAFFEYGLAAEWSVSKLDNSLFWIGQDERGWAVAYRSMGWTPQRISTHAIEQEWNDYPTVSDAIAYSMQADGHQFWHVYFPTANKSWRYDVSTGLWHEPCFWNGSDNVAHRSRVYVFAFNKHLLGDTQSGSLYLTDPTLVTDDVIGAYQNPIRRVRRAPHVTNELEWEFHHRLRVHLETGLGPIPPLNRDPQGVVEMLFQDPTGVYWVANIQDAGYWESAVYATWNIQEEVPITVANFVDLGYLPSQVVVYALGIDTNGKPTLTLLSLMSSGYIQRLPLLTYWSGLQTGLSVQYGQLVIDPPAIAPREPQVMLRWSDDGGHTWSNEYPAGAGMRGDFRRRVEWRRMGRTRDRVYELAVTDPILWRVVDAYLFSSPSNQQPMQRYATQMAKMA